MCRTSCRRNTGTRPTCAGCAERRGGQGLRVAGEPTFEFSASHFTATICTRRHTFDLKPRPEVILNLDAAQRGLGTASCGPDTLAQYCLLEKEYRFAYRLALLDG